ncbi:hypothetical protein DYBT9275_03299 [Dyadobacter sp. CECT 9275]|uniref:Uncharacterized protein n=1 Tax=Dyadobacter helix TaxID=2822344 RepID=A0A916JD70_9BACT|nr:hypothetical protein [Dyadobacter sp. CECT 9275]CAG5004103.1 hypothetical protein DYBT9275_03299 [Dyadobacter sp. CECT 9275]
MPRFVIWITIAAVIFIFLLYNFYFSVNFPFQDDFLLIQFVDGVSRGEIGLWGFVKELFRTFNDHKPVVSRLIAFVDYLLTGHLNFRFYILLVSLNIVYIFYFIYLQFKKTGMPLYYLLPAFFLFFQPLFHDVSGWALNGLQHSYLTAFTVTAIMLVSRGRRVAFAAALLCCFLATFSHGNGILSFPAIIFFFLCYKKFWKAAITAAVMFLALGIYLIGYESGQAVHLPTNILTFIYSLFGFIGSSVSMWAAPEFWSAVLGAVMVAFILFLVVRVAGVYFNREVVIKPGTVELLTFFVFIFITSLVIAVFRSWMGSTIASRFQIYTSLATIICYVLLLDYFAVFRKKGVFYTLLLLSVFYWSYSYYMHTHIVANKRMVYLADVYNWEDHSDMFSVEKTITQYGAFYLFPAYEKGIFKLPPPVVNRHELDSMYTVSQRPDTDSEIFVEVWKLKDFQNNGFINLSFVSSLKFPERKGFLTDRFLVLRDTSGICYLMGGNAKVESRKVLLTTGFYYKNGFHVTLRKDDLKPGVYELAVMDIEANGDKKFYRLDKSLRQTGTSYILE